MYQYRARPGQTSLSKVFIPEIRLPWTVSVRTGCTSGRNLGVAQIQKSRPDFCRILTPVIKRFCWRTKLFVLIAVGMNGMLGQTIVPDRASLIGVKSCDEKLTPQLFFCVSRPYRLKVARKTELDQSQLLSKSCCEKLGLNF